MSYSAKIYPLTIPAGGSLPLPVVAAYFKILSSTGPVDVTGDTFGTLSGLRAGHGMEKTKFNRLTLRDASGAENVVQIVIAGENFVDSRTSGATTVEGLVNIAGMLEGIDTGRRQVGQGQAYTFGLTDTVMTGDNTVALQLFNPAASGKRLVVYGWELWQLGNPINACVVAWKNAPLPTARAGAVVSKSRGVASVATAYSNGAGVADDGVIHRIGGATLAQADRTIRPRVPLIVPPGVGLMWLVVTNSQGAVVGVGADVVEEPLV